MASLGLDVTVTRREDPTFAPNGYIYNIYFDGEAQVPLSLRYYQRNGLGIIDIKALTSADRVAIPFSLLLRNQ